MDLLNSSLDFIKNPDNSWILYSIAVFMLVDGIIMRVISQYLPTILPQKKMDRVMKPSLIRLSANLTAIAGVLLAVATYYFSQLQ
ncbi:MAG: hypothetical protein KAG20_05595 [Cocleimonas sp.]|nr:hypothetical protein [Cocleimonas sp.]